MSEMITVRNRALTRGRRCLSFRDGAIKDVDDGELLARGRFPPEMLATDRAQQTAQAKGQFGGASAVSSRMLRNPKRHRRCPGPSNDRYRWRALPRPAEPA
jgi:hypothetical protein